MCECACAQSCVYISSESKQLNSSPCYLLIAGDDISAPLIARLQGVRTEKRQEANKQLSVKLVWTEKYWEAWRWGGVWERVCVRAEGGQGFRRKIVVAAPVRRHTSALVWKRIPHGLFRQREHSCPKIPCLLSHSQRLHSVPDRKSSNINRWCQTCSFRSIQASLHYGSDLTELGAGRWPYIPRSLRLLKHEQGLKSFSVLVYYVTLLIKNNHSTCQIEKEPWRTDWNIQIFPNISKILMFKYHF